ncbi:MAG: hypothetical protein A2293_00180 [Elusimicrobia bacterium RIFOXYB2_FULL_49_7]|nr:MAG: hypothetical protein A2293_00180 [Elusimicrobia bacterium RIFOXYB2_FULL_49_7]
MLKISLEECKNGMVLGKSLYNASGDLLLAAGYRLQDKYLQRLKILGYSNIWIQEEGTENIIPEELINEQLALQTNKAVRETAEMIKAVAQIKGETKEEIDKSLKEGDRFKDIIVVEKIKSVVNDVIDSLLGQPDVLINMNSIRHKDNFLYQHHLDVTIMSILLANRLKLSRFEVAEIALGSILHDIGLVVVPDAIANKGNRLTFQEFTILKEHTSYGYNILKENPRLSPVSTHIAYQHHERQDGAGYPRGLKGENELPSKKRLNQPMGTMHRYAEIVSVADTYDTLVSPRNRAEIKAPDEAIRILIRGASTHLNKHVVDALITLTPSFPVGALVAVIEGPKELLGNKGVVSKNNRANLSRPEVLILYDKDNNRIKPFLLNLANEESCKIQFIMRH